MDNLPGIIRIPLELAALFTALFVRVVEIALVPSRFQTVRLGDYPGPDVYVMPRLARLYTRCGRYTEPN